MAKVAHNQSFSDSFNSQVLTHKVNVCDRNKSTLHCLCTILHRFVPLLPFPLSSDHLLRASSAIVTHHSRAHCVTLSAHPTIYVPVLPFFLFIYYQFSLFYSCFILSLTVDHEFYSMRVSRRSANATTLSQSSAPLVLSCLQVNVLQQYYIIVLISDKRWKFLPKIGRRFVSE